MDNVKAQYPNIISIRSIQLHLIPSLPVPEYPSDDGRMNDEQQS